MNTSARPFRNTSYTKAHRILHWLIAFTFLFILLTVWLRMDWMNKNGITIYLQTSSLTLKERLVKEKAHRPLIKDLDDAGIMQFIENNINKRNKFYMQSSVILDTTAVTADTFTKIIQEYV